MRDCTGSLRGVISLYSELGMALGTTFNEVSRKHLHSPRPLPPPSQLIRRNHRVLLVFLRHVQGKQVRSLLPVTLIALAIPRRISSPTRARQTSALPMPRGALYPRRQFGMRS
jgi:hypothetical protein